MSFQALVKAVAETPIKFAQLKVAMLAQAMMESGLETSDLAKLHNNHWGLKYRPEMEGYAIPVDYRTGSEPSGHAVFCKFASKEEAVKGYWHFLSREPYRGWEAHAANPLEYFSFIGPTYCPPGFTERWKKEHNGLNYAQYITQKLVPEAEKMLSAYKGDTVKKIKIGLNAGHAGTTGAGGKNPKVQEHIENAVQRDRVLELLTASGKFDCVKIDQTSFNGNLVETGKGFKGLDVGIAFHQNASDRVEHGAECILGNTNVTVKSKELGTKLATAMALALGIKDRGVKLNGLSIASGAASVALPCFVLTECQFIDDETDPTIARKKTLLAADAIAKTIIEFYK